METNAVYVFIIAVPSQPPKDQKHFDIELWEQTRDIVKNLDYVSEWIEDELYFIHYHYFYSFNQVILKLGKLAEKDDKVKIIPANNHSSAKLLVQIGYRIGYIYDTKSAFAFMLNQKIENPAEL